MLIYGSRVCVPDDVEPRREIMEEAHYALYAMHPRSTKMYLTLKPGYWVVLDEEGCSIVHQQMSDL